MNPWTLPPQPNQAQYSLNELCLFPRYLSQEDYTTKTGLPCPTFDASQPVKYWVDPWAAVSPYAGPPGSPASPVVTAPAIYGSIIIYPANNAQKAAIAMLLTQAARPNIPPDHYTGGGNLQGTALPLRELLPNEKLIPPGQNADGSPNPLQQSFLVVRTDLFVPPVSANSGSSLDATSAAAILQAVSDLRTFITPAVEKILGQ